MMVKNFSVLKKALGFSIDLEMILCLIDKKMLIDQHTIAYPIKLI